MGPGVGDKGAMRGDLRFVALQRVLVELRRAEVPVDRGKIAEPEPVRAEVELCAPFSIMPQAFPLKARARNERA